MLKPFMVGLSALLLLSGPLVGTAHARNEVTATGSNNCSVSGKLRFNPPLINGGSAPTVVKMKASIVNCTNNTFGITGGNLKGSFTLDNNNCLSAFGAFVNSSMKWHGASKFAPSLTSGGTARLTFVRFPLFVLDVGPGDVPGEGFITGSFADEHIRLSAHMNQFASGFQFGEACSPRTKGFPRTGGLRWLKFTGGPGVDLVGGLCVVTPTPVC